MDSDLYKWNELVVAGAAKSGRPWTNAQHYKQWMEEIGFEDVVEKKFFWPTNSWPKGAYFKQVAIYWQADILRGLEGISLKVIGALGWSAEEIRAFLPAVKKDIKDTSIHAYLPMLVAPYFTCWQTLIIFRNVVYGRKPMNVS